MKIDFDTLIEQSGDRKLTIPKLAQEMTDAGLFKNKKSAYDMIHYHLNGKAKSCDFQLLLYLIKRFKKPAQEIINWQ